VVICSRPRASSRLSPDMMIIKVVSVQVRVNFMVKVKVRVSVSIRFRVSLNEGIKVSSKDMKITWVMKTCIKTTVHSEGEEDNRKKSCIHLSSFFDYVLTLVAHVRSHIQLSN
jgi:hypothetical protein